MKKLRYLTGEDTWQTRFLAPKDLADGTYRVRLLLRDKQGRTYRESKTFVIASQPPVVKVKLGTTGTGASRRQAVKLHVSASETTRTIVARMHGAAPVYLKWNAGMGSEHGRNCLMPATFAAGKYKLTDITAEDFAHNIGSREVEIEINSFPNVKTAAAALANRRILRRARGINEVGREAASNAVIASGSGVLPQRTAAQRARSRFEGLLKKHGRSWTKLIGAAPNDAELYSLRALEDEQQLDFAAAETDWKKNAEVAKDKGAALLALADFYHRRLRSRDEFNILLTAAFEPTPTSEKIFPPSAQRPWKIFQRSVDLIDEARLDPLLAIGQYNQWIARYPAETNLYRSYFSIRDGA